MVKRQPLFRVAAKRAAGVMKSENERKHFEEPALQMNKERTYAAAISYYMTVE